MGGKREDRAPPSVGIDTCFGGGLGAIKLGRPKMVASALVAPRPAATAAAEG